MTLFSLVLLVVLLAVGIDALGAPRVLVVGAGGRVGRLVVQNLVSKGLPVTALVRDAIKAHGMSELAGATIMQGDVMSLESLQCAIKDCAAVIDVHGPSPLRYWKPRDLLPFAPRSSDTSHPFNVNYLGTKNLVAVSVASGVRKYVRLTGALVGASAFNPFIALFNLLLSFSNYWHCRSENIIRSSGLNYSVIRPTEIVSRPSAQAQTLPPVGGQCVPEYLLAMPGDRDLKTQRMPVPSGVSIVDVVDLLCTAATATGESGLQLQRSTIAVTSQNGTGPHTVAEMLCAEHEQGSGRFRDTLPLVPVGPARLAVSLYTAAVGAVMYAVSRGVVGLLKLLASRLPLVVARMQ